jgi:hypothetical protein
MWMENSEKLEKNAKKVQILLEIRLCSGFGAQASAAEITIAVFLKSW